MCSCCFYARSIIDHVSFRKDYGVRLSHDGIVGSRKEKMAFVRSFVPWAHLFTRQFICPIVRSIIVRWFVHSIHDYQVFRSFVDRSVIPVINSRYNSYDHFVHNLSFDLTFLGFRSSVQ